MEQCVLQGNGKHKTKQAENGGQNSTTNKFLRLRKQTFAIKGIKTLERFTL